jgi:cation-transporting ATPase I
MARGEARQVVADSLRLAAGGSVVGALISIASLGPGRVAAAPSASSVAGAMTLMDGARRARALTTRRMPVRVDSTAWHALPVDEVLTLLDTRPDGLSVAAARERVVSGPRAASPPRQFLHAVRHELANPLTPILAAGAGLSAMAGSLGDAVLVSGVVMSNAVVGGAQRFQADRAMTSLLRQRPRRVTAFRDGQSLEVQAHELVRGDVVRLQAGEAVPADCRIIGGRAVEVDESALTGESLPVTKSAEPVAPDLAVAERTCMLYEGTWVVAGEVTAVVVATGAATEARRADMLVGTPPEAGVEARLHEWTGRTIPLAVGGGAAVMLSGLLRGRPLRKTLGAGVSLTVAAVPEGLPLLATAAQLAAARRLARHNVLVRNPGAIEALGRVDVLCADKTGTLTEGHIELHAISNGRTCRDADDLDEEAHRILRVALRATPVVEDPQSLPHPTDRAIARAGLRHAEGLDALGESLGGWSASYELPFEPARGFHASAGRSNGGGRLAVKGAPEAVLPRCTSWQVNGTTLRLGPKRRTQVAAEVDRLAARGLRVLAVASGDLTEPTVGEVHDDALTGLTLRGLLALADPARATSAEAVRALTAAGVRTLMITGDHPSTARGIGVELGLLDGDGDERMMTGPQIDACTDAALADRVTRVRVFARVTPAHKVRIVRALQSRGCAVAMTGDGANDAPAIRLADVGIALGTRGTAAAQSAADMVVLDDRIETLTEAIAEGRALWVAVRDAVAMLVGGNIGEIAFTVLGSVLDGSPPLNARQLLLVNTLTDALPAIAIAVRRPGQHDARLLDEGPDRSLGSALDHAIAAQAIGATAATTATWGIARVLGPRPWARTVGLATLVGTQLGNTLVAGGRDPFVALSALGSAAVLVVVVQTPGVGAVFGCVPLGPIGWSLALAGATAGTATSQLIPAVLERRAAAGSSVTAPDRHA